MQIIKYNIKARLAYCKKDYKITFIKQTMCLQYQKTWVKEAQRYLLKQLNH